MTNPNTHMPCAYSSDAYSSEARGLSFHYTCPEKEAAINPLEMIFLNISIHHHKDNHYIHFVNLLNSIYCS